MRNAEHEPWMSRLELARTPIGELYENSLKKGEAASPRRGWKAEYIEKCTFGLEGGTQKPDLETDEGAGCLPYFPPVSKTEMGLYAAFQMTQNINATSPSNTPEPPQQPAQAAKFVKPTKTKRQKNLYEPYFMPMFLWRLIRVVVRIFLAIVFDIHVVGRQNVPETGQLIIASNHLSWIDVLLIPAFLKRRVVYMAKEEAFKARGGWIVRFFGSFPVKRGEADRQSLRTAEKQLKAGRILCIFPEGTRSKIHTLAQAHAGMGMVALRSDAPVLPVAIYGSENSFKKFRPRITIIFGEPMILAPKGKKITREDIDQSTEQVMLRIASMLPPAYRGVYAEKLAATEAPAEDTFTE